MSPFIQIIHFFSAFREVIRQTNVRAITLTINVTPKSINASSIKLPVWTRLKLHRTDWQSCWQSSYPVKTVKRSVYWNCRLPSLPPSFPRVPCPIPISLPHHTWRQYGNTALLITSQRVAPSAYIASRCSFGTAFMESLDTAVIIGIVIIASTNLQPKNLLRMAALGKTAGRPDDCRAISQSGVSRPVPAHKVPINNDDTGDRRQHFNDKRSRAFQPVRRQFHQEYRGAETDGYCD